VIDDLDRTLQELLRRELPPSLVQQVAISFATPDDRFPPSSVTLPAINLFLYEIQENRDLRDAEWRTERTGNGTSSRQRVPVRVDCSYLVTAWPSATAPNPPLDEHRLLGEIMQALLRYPSIPVEAVRDHQPVPMPAAVLHPGRLASLAEFWQALGGRPRAALNLTVTISVPVGEAVETGPPVTDKRLKFRLLHAEDQP
jgi:hypothetical protein